MKKHFLFLLIATSISITAEAQTRGIRIGYIDMEYILQNVSDYAEAKNQLEQKAQKWKQEIETKRNEINTLKETLKTERVLLTKELIEEREEEITFQETELLEYQQKRFGPAGDLIIQKSVLVKPIQDQVFTATQDIAEAKKYDFIFDKSSDLTMLFAAKRFDISDQVIRVITRSAKRDQMTKKQIKAEEAKEYEENLIDENPAMAERQKLLDERKAAREKLIEDRKATADAKKKAAEDRRKELLEERDAKRTGTVLPKKETKTVETGENKQDTQTDSTVTENPREKAAEARAKIIEDRKKALEDRKKKILEDREAAKQAKENKTD